MTGARGGLAINGRFLAVPKPTGVQRVARELVRELAGRCEELTGLFAAAPRVSAPSGVHEQLGIPLEAGRLSGHAWEQAELPIRARGRTLLNLCNLAPVGASRTVTMIHDAQVFTAPQSYSRAFRSYYRAVQPIIGRRAALVLTVSDHAARDLVRCGIARAERIRVVPNGVDHVLRIAPDRRIVERLGLQRGRYVLAPTARAPHKNTRVLIEAFAEPALDDLTLVLVGGDPFEHPPRANIIDAGRVSDPELVALMADALCFAMPSTTEGFGLPPLEAMALGCPAIVARAGALPETCGDAALFADPAKPEEWHAAVRLLADDREAYAERRAAGLAHAGRATWRHAGDALMSALREAASASSAPVATLAVR